MNNFLNASLVLQDAQHHGHFLGKTRIFSTHKYGNFRHVALTQDFVFHKSHRKQLLMK